MDNVRFRENCTLLAGAKGKKWLLDLEISCIGQVKYLFVNLSPKLQQYLMSRKAFGEVLYSRIRLRLSCVNVQ